jgi:hypothetical protein
MIRTEQLQPMQKMRVEFYIFLMLASRTKILGLRKVSGDALQKIALCFSFCKMFLRTILHHHL